MVHHNDVVVVVVVTRVVVAIVLVDNHVGFVSDHNLVSTQHGR